MAQMGNAEAVFDGGVQHTGPLDGVNNGTVYADVNILLHVAATSLS
jgi:hypothetical protein